MLHAFAVAWVGTTVVLAALLGLVVALAPLVRAVRDRVVSEPIAVPRAVPVPVPAQPLPRETRPGLARAS